MVLGLQLIPPPPPPPPLTPLPPPSMRARAQPLKLGVPDLFGLEVKALARQLAAL